MYKSKSCMHFIIHNKISGIDSTFFDSTFKLFAKHIITYFSDKGSLFTKTVQHGKNIARSPARIGLESWISLGTFAVFCKVDQKLAESCYIIQSVFHLCFLLIIFIMCFIFLVHIIIAESGFGKNQIHLFSILLPVTCIFFAKINDGNLYFSVKK